MMTEKLKLEPKISDFQVGAVTGTSLLVALAVFPETENSERQLGVQGSKCVAIH